MPAAMIESLRLEYDRLGNGDVAVLVSGTGMPPVAWDICGVRNALVDAGYEVITYAARGVAPSDAPPPPYAIAEMAHDLVGLLAYLGISRSVFVGYSLGGFTVEHLAYAYPDLVEAAVLIASAGPSTPVLRAAVETETALIAELGYLPAAFSRFETLHSTLSAVVLRDDEPTTATWWDLLAAQASAWTSAQGACGQAAAAYGWVHDAHRMERLREIRSPVLVIAFEHDLYFPPRAGRIAASLLPDSEFVEIAEAGHGGLMTHSKQCIEVLRSFLKDRRSAEI